MTPANTFHTCNVWRTMFAVYISMQCKMSSKDRSSAFSVLVLLLSSASKNRAAVSIRRLQIWWASPTQKVRQKKEIDYQEKDNVEGS